MARMARVHRWVVLEEAQFDRNHVRPKFRQRRGNLFDVAPDLSDANRKPFNSVKLLDAKRYADQLRRMADITFGGSDHYRALKVSWAELLDDIAASYSLNTLCDRTTKWQHRVLGLDTEICMSRDLVNPRPTNPTEWMGSFSPKLHATDYVQGQWGLDAYFDMRVWPRKVRVWTHVTPQALSNLVEPIMSGACAIFLHGPDKVRQALHAHEKPGKTDGIALYHGA